MQFLKNYEDSYGEIVDGDESYVKPISIYSLGSLTYFGDKVPLQTPMKIVLALVCWTALLTTACFAQDDLIRDIIQTKVEHIQPPSQRSSIVKDVAVIENSHKWYICNLNLIFSHKFHFVPVFGILLNQSIFSPHVFDHWT